MSGMYTKGIASIMGADVDLINDSISALIVDLSLYTPDLVNNQYQSDIPTAAILGETLLIGKSLDSTTFRADDTEFSSVEDIGQTVTGVVVLKDTGSSSTSILLCMVDDAPEFPVTPDGTDIIIEWDTGAEGIFAF